MYNLSIDYICQNVIIVLSNMKERLLNMTRADVVRAMEIMVSTINDESIIDSWLMVGVADGDITADTTNEEIEEMGYTEDTTFTELLTLFLKLMNRAGNDGLYFDKILSGSKSITWSEGRKVLNCFT